MSDTDTDTDTYTDTETSDTSEAEEVDDSKMGIKVPLEPQNEKPEILSKLDFSKCYFIPRSTMDAVRDLEQSVAKYRLQSCNGNLYTTQIQSCVPRPRAPFQGFKYQMALRRAVYSHDWNRVLFLLKRLPIWAQKKDNYNNYCVYIRAMTLVLMYHPLARDIGALNDYLHLVLSCRTVGDKKALLKTLLTLYKNTMHQLGRDEVSGTEDGTDDL